MTDSRRAGWTTILTVFITALVVVIAGDQLLSRVVPPTYQREVDDAVASYRHADPTILVVGSSHARTFDVLDEELRRRTDGRERVLSVPVEWGKLTTYRFVLEERLRRSIEETRGGEKVRPSLKRLVLVTEWWDTTPPDDGQRATNLPARAWAFRHFASDVWDHGFDAFNRNYLNAQWRRLFRRSVLVQDHGHGSIVPGLIGLVRPPPPSARERLFDERVVDWNRMLEAGDANTLDPEQMQAFTDILAMADEWGLEVTVMLYPRMPVTVTDKARATTIARYTRAMNILASRYGFRLIDYTTSSPLTDDHFAMDFDHVTREGNELFSEWALDRELGFLVTSKGVR